MAPKSWKPGEPCWCGSRLFAILRVVVRGVSYVACKRCAGWTLLQSSSAWGEIATRERET